MQFCYKIHTIASVSVTWLHIMLLVLVRENNSGEIFFLLKLECVTKLYNFQFLPIHMNANPCFCFHIRYGFSKSKLQWISRLIYFVFLASFSLEAKMKPKFTIFCGLLQYMPVASNIFSNDSVHDQIQGPLKIWTEQYPQSHFWNYNLGRQIRKHPRTLGLFGGFYKVHTKIFLMKGQTLFWGHYRMVIDLLKRGHFLTNYTFWLLSLISDKGKILNFPTIDKEPL